MHACRLLTALVLPGASVNDLPAHAFFILIRLATGACDALGGGAFCYATTVAALGGGPILSAIFRRVVNRLRGGTLTGESRVARFAAALQRSALAFRARESIVNLTLHGIFRARLCEASAIGCLAS